MIEPLQQTSAPAHEPRRATRSAGQTGGFAAAMATATASQQGAGAAEGATDARLEELRRKLRPPRGERWEAVPGRRDYADIVSGPRNGMYVNLAPGPRQGQAFNIVRAHGRELHVYGSGREREVVEVRRRPPDPDSVRPRAGETFVEVPGHRRYKQIEGGPRDDLYINLSGNARTGMAFRIVERDGQRLHVYGSGRDRIEVEVGGRARRPGGETGATPPAGGTAPASGTAPAGDAQGEATAGGGAGAPS